MNLAIYPMKTTRKKHSSQSALYWRTIRIPLSQIERIYGNGNYDDAGDDLICALRGIRHRANGECHYRFDLDCSDDNPWFHVLIFEVADLSEEEFATFISHVQILKLWDDDFQTTIDLVRVN